MPRVRYTMKSLFGLVAFAALGCAAMVKPSYVWASGVWTLTTAILAGTTVGCFFGTGRSRAFCVGFALFGWGHMILFLAPWFDDHTGELLFSRHIVDFAGDRLGHKVTDHVSMPGIWTNLAFADSGAPPFVYLAFVVIGQSMLTLVVGLFGGLIGRYLSDRSPRRPAESSATPG